MKKYLGVSLLVACLLLTSGCNNNDTVADGTEVTSTTEASTVADSGANDGVLDNYFDEVPSEPVEITDTVLGMPFTGTESEVARFTEFGYVQKPKVIIAGVQGKADYQSNDSGTIGNFVFYAEDITETWRTSMKAIIDFVQGQVGGAEPEELIIYGDDEAVDLTEEQAMVEGRLLYLYKWSGRASLLVEASKDTGKVYASLNMYDESFAAQFGDMIGTGGETSETGNTGVETDSTAADIAADTGVENSENSNTNTGAVGTIAEVVVVDEPVIATAVGAETSVPTENESTGVTAEQEGVIGVSN